MDAPRAASTVSKIRTPIAVRWREFRVRFVPILMFALTALAVGIIWRVIPSGAMVRGIGDGPTIQLSAPQDGFIEMLQVQPFEWVEAGELLVRIRPFDPQAELDVLQIELQLLRLAAEPSLADRNALDYERLRVDALRLRQELAMAQANLDRAAKALPRHEALLEEKLISRDIYDLTVRDRDYYQAEVEEKGKALAEIEQRLQDLQALAQPDGTELDFATEEFISRLERQLELSRTNWTSATLRAPRRGQVQFHRSAGEFVRRGDPLLVINPERAERIVAYLKAPVSFEPQVGMRMEVRTRSPSRQRIATFISQVGARVEIITNSLAYLPVGALVDTGLPIVLPLPAESKVRTGEIVDVLPLPSEDDGSIFQQLLGDLR